MFLRMVACLVAVGTLLSWGFASAQGTPEAVTRWPSTTTEQQELARKQEKVTEEFSKLMANNGIIEKARCRWTSFPHVICTVPLGCKIAGYSFIYICE